MKKIKYLISVFSLLALFLVIPIGISLQGQDSIIYWNKNLLVDFLIWLVVTCSLALGLDFYKIKNKSLLLIFALLVYLSIGLGWGQSVAASYFFISSYFMGRIFLYLFFKMERKEILFDQSIIIGVGCYICFFGVLIHFPINYFEIYIVFLAIPLLLALVLNFPNLYKSKIIDKWRNISDKTAAVSYWRLTAAVVVIGYVARYAFFPSVNYDDNALHLRIWTVLANRHSYDFDIRSQIWAVAPFIVDLLHAIISIVSQADARGAMNFFLLASLLYFMWQLAGLINRRLDDRLIIITLFATTPLLAGLLTGLQTELLLAVLATSGVLFALRRRSTLSGSEAAAIMMIAALCCGTKLPGAILGVALLATLLLELLINKKKKLAIEFRYDFLGLLIITFVAGFVAFHSYFFAWYITGNPVFPLYNGYFKSPFFPIKNFLDMRYVSDLSFKTYFNVFFNTDKYFESKNFVAGFQYLLLLPLAISILFFFKRWAAFKILFPLFLFGFVMFSTVQYWRYIFPILPLASVMIGLLFLGSRSWNKNYLYHNVTTFVLMMFAAVNLFFLPGISWYFNIPTQEAFTESGRQKILARLAPEQLLNKEINQYAPGISVLYEPSRPYGATLLKSPTYVNWYAPAVEEKKKLIRTPDEMKKFLQDENIKYVYWNLSMPFDVNDTYRYFLRKHINIFGIPELIVGTTVAYRLKEYPEIYRKVLHINDFNKYNTLINENGATISKSGAILVGSVPLMLQKFDIGMASSFRYSVEIECPIDGAVFVAQINWNIGDPYYRLVNCNKNIIKFSESAPVPVVATEGLLYLTSRDHKAIKINDVMIELN